MTHLQRPCLAVVTRSAAARDGSGGADKVKVGGFTPGLVQLSTGGASRAAELSASGATGPDPALFSLSGSISLDNLQSLSSDNATMAMQQAMMAAHEDSLDGTEEEDEDEMEEEEEEELEEEADELQTTNVGDLGLEHSDPLE